MSEELNEVKIPDEIPDTVKISATEINDNGIANLRTVPGQGGTYGANGMSAADIKARFDALPKLIAGKVNQVIDGHNALVAATAKLNEKADGIADGLADEVHARESAIEKIYEAISELEETLSLLTSDAPEWLDTFDEVASIFNDDPKFLEKIKKEIDDLAEKIVDNISSLKEDLQSIEEQKADKKQLDSFARQDEITAIRKRLKNLEGGWAELFTDDSSDTVKTVPYNALPFAAIREIGGDTKIKGDTLVDTNVTGLYIEGTNLLPCPYPHSDVGIRFGVVITFNEDGTIVLDGKAERGFSLALYDENDNLSLPKSGVYIHDCGSTTLYVKSDANTRHSCGNFYPNENDEYYGRYFVYIDIQAGAVYRSVKLYPCISKGLNFRPANTYLKPYTYSIPDYVLSMKGYGKSMQGLRNKIQWDDNGKATYIMNVVEVRCDQKKLWRRTETSDGIRYEYWTQTTEYPMTRETIALVSNKYPGRFVSGGKPCVYGYGQRIFVYDDSIEDDGTVNPWLAKLDEWESSGEPFRVIYPVATPEKTDIPELSDNIVEVRKGGTITVVSETGGEASTAIEYQLEG